jgi:hypothetical protein
MVSPLSTGSPGAGSVIPTSPFGEVQPEVAGVDTFDLDLGALVF